MKKIVSSVLAVSMALSLAACGSTADTSSEASSASTGSSTSSAATGETAASGTYTGTPIKLGGIGPTTGSTAVYGTAVMNAEELAVNEINEANAALCLSGSLRTMKTMLKRASTHTTP